MKKINIIICVLLLFSFKALPQEKEKWVKLFNGKDFSGWDTYWDQNWIVPEIAYQKFPWD